MCHTRNQAEQVWRRLGEWLVPRGLAFNEDKTHIVHAGPGLRLPGIQHPPLPRQAAHQTQPGGDEADPAAARCRSALPAGSQRRSSDRTAQPQSSGAGPPMTGTWSPKRRSPRSIITCGSTSIGGRCAPTRTSRDTGSSTVFRRVQPVQDRTGGSSVTATAASTCASSSGPRSSATDWSWEPRRPTTRPWTSTGQIGAAKRTRSWAESPRPCCYGSTDAAPAATRSCCPPTTVRKAHTNGASGPAHSREHSAATPW